MEAQPTAAQKLYSFTGPILAEVARLRAVNANLLAALEIAIQFIEHPKLQEASFLKDAIWEPIGRTASLEQARAAIRRARQG